MAMLQGPAAIPVQGAERMDVLDAVRGAAVLGILLANVIAMSGFPFLPPVHYRSLPLAGWHELSFFLVLLFVEAKFYSLFSLLFGVGFAVFIQRAAARGADAPRLFKRRLTGLLIIGLIHTFFIWKPYTRPQLVQAIERSRHEARTRPYRRQRQNSARAPAVLRPQC